MTRRERCARAFVLVGASKAREAFPDPGASNVYAETEGRAQRSMLAAARSSMKATA
jgi:hypothetical protein